MTTIENHSQAITPVVEDYLKTIYLLRGTSRKSVKTVSLARQLKVKPPTVTAMLKTLAELKFVIYEPYKGVELTQTGEIVALEVVRHHRLIELYLVQALGFSWDEVHDEAEVLEHFISEKLEARIAAYLGDPTHDPHGDPIPAMDGSIVDSSGAAFPLTALLKNTTGLVKRVIDQDSDRLRYLAELGLVPGAIVKVIKKAPFEGPLTVQINEQTHALDCRLAQTIIVEE